MNTKGVKFLALLTVFAMTFAFIPMMDEDSSADPSPFGTGEVNNTGAIGGITYKITTAYDGDNYTPGQVVVTNIDFGTDIKITVPSELSFDDWSSYNVVNINLGNGDEYNGKTIYTKLSTETENMTKGGATVIQVFSFNVDRGTGPAEHFTAAGTVIAKIEGDAIKFYNGSEATLENHIEGKDISLAGYTNIYKAAMGTDDNVAASTEGVAHTMDADTTVYLRNMTTVFYSFYIDLSYNMNDNDGAWFYGHAQDGLPGTALINILNDTNNKLDGKSLKETITNVSGTGWLTINPQSVEGGGSSNGCKVSSGCFYLDENNAWIASGGLNSCESDTYYIEIVSQIKRSGYDDSANEEAKSKCYDSFGYSYLTPSSDALITPVVTAQDTVGAHGEESTFTFMADVTEYPNVNGYAAVLIYDSTKLELNPCANLVGSGDATVGDETDIGSGTFKFVKVGLALSADATTSNGLFKATFTVNSECTDHEIPLYYFIEEISTDSGKVANMQKLRTAMILTGAETVAVGKTVMIKDVAVADGKVVFAFDSDVFKFVSANGSSITITDGSVTVESTSSVTASFVVKEGAKAVMSTISFNDMSNNYQIVPSSRIVVPVVSSASDSAAIVFSSIPAISGFILDFAYAGGTPDVSKTSVLPDTLLSIINDANARKVSIRWASSSDEFVNGNVLNIKGVTGLTLVGSKLTNAVGEEFFATSVSSIAALSMDLNGDGSADIHDLVALMKVLAHADVALPQSAICDINGDGAVDIIDAMQLAKEIA